MHKPLQNSHVLQGLMHIQSRLLHLYKLKPVRNDYLLKITSKYLFKNYCIIVNKNV